MRIRKNANLSPLLFSEAHICQLNQSPWDVLSLSSSQFEYEDNSLTAANTSLADSAGVVDSVVSAVDGNNKVEDNAEEEREMGMIGRDSMLVYCNKTDGKRWHCKRFAKQGHSMCVHHLNQLKSYSYNKKNYDSNNVSAKKSATVKKLQARSVKKGSLSTQNPYEFYYYSGFGPKWGKKRSSTRSGKNMGKKNAVEASECESQSSSMENDDEEIDYVDDEEELEDNGTEKKKLRKPVKARSLKSLL